MQFVCRDVCIQLKKCKVDGSTLHISCKPAKYKRSLPRYLLR